MTAQVLLVIEFRHSPAVACDFLWVHSAAFSKYAPEANTIAGG